MGTYESKYWLSDGIGMNRKEKRSGTYYLFLPDAISDKEIMLHGDAIKAFNKAEAALATLNRTADDSAIAEPSARLILRSEALASSRIEGLEIPAKRLLEEDALLSSGIAHHATDKESALLGNIALMEDAVNESSLAAHFTVEGISHSNFLLLQKQVSMITAETFERPKIGLAVIELIQLVQSMFRQMRRMLLTFWTTWYAF